MNQANANHPSEEDLVHGYYDGLGSALQIHLDNCQECERLYRSICETLNAATEDGTPERGAGYGAEVWARLQPKLPLEKSKPGWVRWRLFAPAAAVLTVMVFVAGMLTEHKRTLPPLAQASGRVLYLSLSEHLEQAQIMLTELAHAAPAGPGLAQERERARDLVMQNRILRQRALRAGDRTDAAVLDDLERVLLEVANSDSDLEAVQRRMEEGNLLFRVRISGSDARMKGEKL